MLETTDQARRQAESLFLSAYQAQAEGRYEEAVRLYRRSLDVFPTAEAHTFMGWAYSYLARYEEAIRCCRRAIEIDAEYGNPYNDIGAYLLELGRTREAIPWLRRALRARRYDCSHFAHYNLGRAHENLLDPIEAEQCYRRALSMSPRYTVARQALRRVTACYN